MWSLIIGSTISPEQVLLCMAALKLAREAGMHDPDNIEDVGGYMSLIPEVRAWQMDLNKAEQTIQQTRVATERYEGVAKVGDRTVHITGATFPFEDVYPPPRAG